MPRESIFLMALRFREEGGCRAGTDMYSLAHTFGMTLIFQVGVSGYSCFAGPAVPKAVVSSLSFHFLP